MKPAWMEQASPFKMMKGWRTPQLTTRNVAIAVFGVFFFALGIHLVTGDRGPTELAGDIMDGDLLGHHRPDNMEEIIQGDHPIDRLVAHATSEWQSLLAKESKTVFTAAEQYRRRRGRHPPPGFAEWFEYAQSKDAIIVEDFFDQIYNDLNPFWGLEPREIRRRAQGVEPRIVVRDHVATTGPDGSGIWMKSWLELVKTFEEHLPDLDMPTNQMDESRIVAPWETIAEYIAKEQAGRRNLTDLDDAEARSEFTPLPDHEESAPFAPKYFGSGEGPVWHLVRDGCSPDSPSRTSETTDVDVALRVGTDYVLTHTQSGYVTNWTEVKDICIRPEMQALYGTFVEPISVSTTHDFFPLFGGSKLSVNNEILIPPGMYWADDIRYSGGKTHGGRWSSKTDTLMWRGSASGGRNRESNWHGFQRHRLLAMLNGTHIEDAEANDAHKFLNFLLPDYDAYNLTSAHSGHLSEFVDEHVDVGFNHLACYPCAPDKPPCEYDMGNPHCHYTEPFFEVVPILNMKEQYAAKYLPDVDGNSFSGRYRGFLLSTSLPIKATIYEEWHDSRLVPWAHFVPMDPTFIDLYGIMEYFIGYGDKDGHDAVAERIALDGKEWAEKVLRHDDMQIYVYRLLLEYARICDDNRDVLGYAEDILWKSTQV